MYKRYYGMHHKPFENTPDPTFLYLSKQHREVLTSLKYGIESAKGFILVAGDVGTGKTTLIRSVSAELSSDHIIINIINPRTSFDDIFNHLAYRLKVRIRGVNRLESIEKIRDRLVDLNNEGRRVVILIDEAHLLSEDSLEEIRLLSNIETEQIKLIQIVLVGQNEIYALLNRKKQRPLKQRIVIDRQLSPLSKNDMVLYIEHRLLVAGRKNSLFNKEALKLIWLNSRGTPRRINRLCDNALLIGYAVDAREINKKIILEVLDDMGPRSRIIKNNFFLTDFWLSSRWGRTLGVCGLLLFIIVIAGINIFYPKDFSIDARSNSTSFTKQQAVSSPIAMTIDIPEQSSSKVDTDHEKIKKQFFKNKDDKKTLLPTHNQEPLAYKQEKYPAKAHSGQQQGAGQQHVEVASKRVKMTNNSLSSLRIKKGLTDAQQLLKSQIIQPNQWLTSLAAKEYGMVSSTLLDLIQMANRKIINIDHIYYGQKIFLPVITRDSMIVTGEGNNFHIHYASFYKLYQARKVTRNLLDAGREAFFVPSRQGENEVFRVYIGNFAERAAAEKCLKTIEFKNLPFLGDVKLSQYHAQPGAFQVTPPLTPTISPGCGS